MSTGLIDIIKRAANDANEASQPSDLRYGTITQVNPLKVQITPQFIIPESMLIVPKLLTDFKVPVSFNWRTLPSVDNHSHQITSDSGEKTMTVHNGLRIGDYVALIRQSGGKKYFIVGVLVRGANADDNGGSSGSSGSSGSGTETPSITQGELEQMIRDTFQGMIDSGEFTLTADDVGALGKDDTAKNSEKLGNKTINEILSTIYPVGSIYMSVNNVNPATLFGGTWERIKDTFLLSAGDKYSAGAIGGEATHSHKYGVQVGMYYGSPSIEQNSNAGVFSYDSKGQGSIVSFSSSGLTASAKVNSGTTNGFSTYDMGHLKSEGYTSISNNMPPYLAVYMWKRTA